MTSSSIEIIKDFTSRGAPVDVEGLARALGVDVQYSWLDSDISGQIEQLPNGRYKITVNAADPVTRQRFTLAHELGHFVYHRPLIGNGVDDDRAYRSTNKGIYHNTAIGPREETQANQFAANILMPYSLINQHDPAVGAKELAGRFGVSEQAMCIRLGIPYGARQIPQP